MADRIGQNINVKDKAVLSGNIALNSSTAVTIQAIDLRRIFWSVSNPENFAIYVKLQAASIDNDKNGIYIAGNGYWEMPSGDKYTGEICAIAASDTPEVFTTQY
ncbi:MAG: hypothetical protein JKY98_03925 [Gammaproteobacteria bacterium]|nr:hypothetical protein [Gammaproteobacteria bacterium]